MPHIEHERARFLTSRNRRHALNRRDRVAATGIAVAAKRIAVAPLTLKRRIATSTRPDRFRWLSHLSHLDGGAALEHLVARNAAERRTRCRHLLAPCSCGLLLLVCATLITASVTPRVALTFATKIIIVRTTACYRIARSRHAIVEVLPIVHDGGYGLGGVVPRSARPLTCQRLSRSASPARITTAGPRCGIALTVPTANNLRTIVVGHRGRRAWRNLAGLTGVACNRRVRVSFQGGRERGCRLGDAQHTHTSVALARPSGARRARPLIRANSA